MVRLEWELDRYRSGLFPVLLRAWLGGQQTKISSIAGIMASGNSIMSSILTPTHLELHWQTDNVSSSENIFMTLFMLHL